MKNSQKGFIMLLPIIIVVVVVGGGIYLFSQNRPFAGTPKTQVSGTTQTSLSFNDSDLRILATRISDSVNSAPVFNTIKSDVITKTDQTFLVKYLGRYSSNSLPPIEESQKILATYSNLLDIFDTNVKKQYQCLFTLGDVCSLQSIRNIQNIIGLRAVTFFQQNKSSEAQSTAYDIVSLGRSITTNADSANTLLVGWSVQNLGYDILTTIKQKGIISVNDKLALIANLRKEQKKVLQYMYTGTADEIDYITSPNNKPSRQLDHDEEDLVNTYRKGASANPTAWNPTETKKFFYSSYKIALSNVDLACGSTPVDSMLNFDFDPQNQQTENYVGKMLYATTYASLDTMSQKRCVIENLIQNL